MPVVFLQCATSADLAAVATDATLTALTPRACVATGTDAASASAPAPPIPCDSLVVSGYSCSNGYGTSPTDQSYQVNAQYDYVGTTADGKPYYQNAHQPNIHLFYDSNCGGGPTPVHAWRTRAGSSDAMHPICRARRTCRTRSTVAAVTLRTSPETISPLGTNTYWRWCGAQGSSGNQQITIARANCSPSPPSPPPPPLPPPVSTYVFITEGICSDTPGYTALATVSECEAASTFLGYTDNDGVVSTSSYWDRPCGCTWHSFGNVELWTPGCSTTMACNERGYAGCFCSAPVIAIATGAAGFPTHPQHRGVSERWELDRSCDVWRAHVSYFRWWCGAART